MATADASNQTAFFLTGKLKESNSGEIYTGFLRDSRLTKIVAKKFKGSQSDQKELLRDFSFHSKLENHDNIIRILGYDLTVAGNYIFMEYEELQINGKIINDLLEYLIHLREEYVTIKQEINSTEIETFFRLVHHQELHLFSFQILKGCEYLQSNGIIHGNLEASNILITQQKTIKLANFDFLSHRKDLIASMKNKTNYYRWAGPEVLKNLEFTVKSDVWSFGIVLYEIGTLGAHPYFSRSDQEVVELKLQMKSLQLLPDECTTIITDELRQIITACCSLLPGIRPDFKTLLSEFKMEKCGRVQDQRCIFYKKIIELGPALEVLLTKEDIDQKTKTTLTYFQSTITSKMRYLERGKFGYVGKLKLNDPILGNITVAIKIINSGSGHASSEKTKLFTEEVETFKKIGLHKNIVKILAVCQEPFGIMMEYQSLDVDHGKFQITNLNQYLKYLRSESDNRLHINNQELGWFAIQIARGMKYLESLGIVHSNLTTKNVLINNVKILKITDFGQQGTGVYKSKDGRTTAENYQWAAPELLLRGLYSSKSDIWAFGVVLWEIATLAAKPFESHSRAEIIPMVIKSKAILPKPKTATSELWNLMTQCWRENPDVRPDFKRVSSILTRISLKKDIYKKYETRNTTEKEFESSLKNISSSYVPHSTFEPCSGDLSHLKNFPVQQPISSQSSDLSHGHQYPHTSQAHTLNLPRRSKSQTPKPKISPAKSQTLPRRTSVHTQTEIPSYGTADDQQSDSAFQFFHQSSTTSSQKTVRPQYKRGISEGIARLSLRDRNDNTEAKF